MSVRTNLRRCNIVVNPEVFTQLKLWICLIRNFCNNKKREGKIPVLNILTRSHKELYKEREGIVEWMRERRVEFYDQLFRMYEERLTR